MKKVLFSISLFTFLLFGVAQVQYVMAADSSIEIVDFDKDPTKDGKKTKAKKSSDCKTTKTNCSTTAKKSCCASKSKATKANCHDAKKSTSTKTDTDKK